ncbi:unnamed protein product [Anisakis simplex]|uniref:Secreted protein n=1 Tax=Anisakis simplex TaxID=6269 RepID=A0A0M3IY70_ANISI|nr:unnamed protein product [Anisakis simplex]
MYACNMTAAAFKWNTDVAVSRRRRLHVAAVSSPTLCCLTLPSCCSLEQCSSSSASSESECSSICSSLCTGLGCCCGISSNSNKRLFGGDGSALSDRDRAAFKNNWQASAHNQHGCARVCCCLDQPKTPAAPLLQLGE